MKKGDLVEGKIESIAFGGAGIMKVDEVVVFVDRVAPGDVVKARIVKKKRKYREAVVEEIVTKSPQRIEPRCQHFGKCGGCKMQFLTYQDQLTIKQQQVQDSLERLGGFKNFTVEPIIGSVDPWFYRNKMEFSFAWDEKPIAGSEDKAVLEIGLHPPKRRFEVVDLQECFLQSPEVIQILETVRQWARNNKLTPYNFRQNQGLLRSFFIREGKYTGEIMVNLVINADECTPDQQKNLEQLVSLLTSDDQQQGEAAGSDVTLFTNHDQQQGGEAGGDRRIVAVYLTTVKVMKGRRTERIEQLLWGKPTIKDQIHLYENADWSQELTKLPASKRQLAFEILPQAFFQPNTRQAGVLYSQIFRFAKINQESVVFDLFCGTGTIALFCAQKAGKVYGIELNESAVVNAKANAATNGLSNAEFIVGDVGKVVEDLDQYLGKGRRPDLIVMDPPRAGVGEKALEKVIAFGAEQIVYVSCNPTTLARDLNFLSNNQYQQYHLESLQPVDMFPQTAHIECVAFLTIKS